MKKEKQKNIEETVIKRRKFKVFFKNQGDLIALFEY
jgi:hypothetical protein